MSEPNLFGFTALEASYRHGDEWLDQVLDYLQGNLDLLMEYTEANIPGVNVIEPQGSYLIWIDFRGLGMDTLDLGKFMLDEAKVGIGGWIYIWRSRKRLYEDEHTLSPSHPEGSTKKN